MSQKIKRAATVLTVAVAVGMLSGCASQELKDQVAEAERIAQAAQREAAAAKSAADAAKSAADAASRAASNAQASADSAKRSADSAQACCQANSEKIDRMFKKSMSK